jgi:hypothetical protein
MAKVEYQLAHDYTSFEMGYGNELVRLDDSGLTLGGEKLELDDEKDGPLISELDQRHEVYRSGQKPKALPEALDESTWATALPGQAEAATATVEVSAETAPADEPKPQAKKEPAS